MILVYNYKFEILKIKVMFESIKKKRKKKKKRKIFKQKEKKKKEKRRDGKRGV